MATIVYFYQVSCASSFAGIISPVSFCLTTKTPQTAYNTISVPCSQTTTYDPNFTTINGCIGSNNIIPPNSPSTAPSFSTISQLFSTSCGGPGPSCPLIAAVASISSSSTSSYTSSVMTPTSGVVPTGDTSSSLSTLSSTSSPTSTLSSTSSPTSTSSSTSSPTSALRRLKHGVSSGAAAGIAISCLIAGAAIAAAILLFFCFGSRRNSRKGSQRSLYGKQYGSEVATELRNSGRAGFSEMDRFLPQPAEDSAITGEMSRLRDKIKNHAQNYYHTSNVEPRMLNQSALQEIANIVGVSPGQMKELLLSPHSRIAAIRVYLASLILSRCVIQTSSESFLPAEVASFASSIAGIDSKDAGEIALASKWKFISGALLQPKYGQQQAAADSAREEIVRRTIARANPVLAVFVKKPSGETNNLQNLEAIMFRAAQFAFLLFSQPSAWKLQWGRGFVDGTLVVFPGLEQSVDDEGRVQSPPRILSEPEIASLV